MCKPEVFCFKCDRDSQSTEEEINKDPIQECNWCSDLLDFSICLEEEE